jgi:hypothetical protein
MKNEQIKFSYESLPKLTISVNRTSLFVKTFIISLTIIFFFTPLAITAFVIMSEIELNFGIVFSYLLCWGSGVYFIRLFLWNSYGKEIIELENDRITYYSDYKYFKDGHKSISNYKIEIKEIEVDMGKKGILKISNDVVNFETTIKLNLSELSNIVNNNNLPITTSRVY